MPLIKITPEDVKRGKILDPSWYDVVISDFNEELAKNKKSNNYIVDFVVETPGAFQGVPLRRYFSEKAVGMMIPFLAALGFPVGEEGGDFNLSRENVVGKKMKVYVQMRKDENDKPQNDVNQFKAA